MSGGNWSMNNHTISQQACNSNNRDVSNGNVYINSHNISQCDDLSAFKELDGGVIIWNKLLIFMSGLWFPVHDKIKIYYHILCGTFYTVLLSVLFVNCSFIEFYLPLRLLWINDHLSNFHFQYWCLFVHQNHAISMSI